MSLITFFMISTFALIFKNQYSEALHDPENLSTRYLRGVHPAKLSYYQSLLDKTHFTCIDGTSSIPIEALNDDFCDCNDGSDEPGTPACMHGEFFCHNQGYLSKIIPSGWVNDGRCDCCDTSDEYNSTVICENNCDTLGSIHRRHMELRREISDRGSALRKEYKLEAKRKRERNNELIQTYKQEVTEKSEAIKVLEEEINSDFGPSSVFLPLKNKCFEHKDREYTYTLCLFEKAVQESISGMQTELGRWSGWIGSSENIYSRQRYDGGNQCWNGPTRSALVNIECGVEDGIISVSEPSKCEYVFEFITPAACPDTDPPEEVPAPQEHQNNNDGGQTSSQGIETEEDLNDSNQDHFSDEHIEPPEGEPLPHRDGTHDEL